MEGGSLLKQAELTPGAEVNGWRVVSPRGSGGYGSVYRVERAEPEPSGPFALKLALRPEDARFEREGELLARLSHPNVPRLWEQGWWKGPEGQRYPYVVMEWVEGVTVYEWAARRARTSREAMRVLAQVARALEATHEVEGLHRDVKGDNMLVREDGHAVLLDFGVGTFRGARPLTWDVLAPGTPEYRSPQAMTYLMEGYCTGQRAYEATPADDVYGLGVTAYRAVTGRYPEWKPVKKGGRVWRAKLVPPEQQVRVCAELAWQITRMLSNDPEARGSAAEVARALERGAEQAGAGADTPMTAPGVRGGKERRAGEGPPREGRARRWWVGAAVVGGALVLRPHASEPPPPETLAGEEARVSRGGKEDGASVGLGDEALPAQASATLPPAERKRIGAEMLKKPLPGQRVPPCEEPEVEINGGCWGRGEAKPPCGPRAYEWKKRCYWPSMEFSSPATSDPP